ncbi:IgA peptidase M64-domain-containing protein [Gloeopeniophorella convolvens]|nr:IgA peptidase M64-domain-containing protein [Gloeopeniophorella convolvens]
MRYLLLLLFLVVAVAAGDSDGDRPYELTVHRDPNGGGPCAIVRARRIPRHRQLTAAQPALIHTALVPAPDDPAAPPLERVTLLAASEAVLRHHYGTLCPADAPGADGSWQHVLAVPEPDALRPPLPLEVVPVAVSGPSANRVDVAFFADGYLPAERAAFLADVARLVHEIAANQTFHAVAPLLNFWAVYTPSREHGVGVGGVPKDTPFGLYRDGTELRGLYYARPQAARAACRALGDRCDYPVLIARAAGNDPLYGGLGGEFTTITPSRANGALVLRHELGHSIIGAGEEYDGGFAYFGPNAAFTPARLPWAHWLPNTSSTVAPRAERAAMPFQAYPWTALNTSTAWRARFASAGTYARHRVRFSLSGVPRGAAQLAVRLDGGAPLRWAAPAGIGEDRWHYDVEGGGGGLVPGGHVLEFELVEGGGAPQLCSAEVLEYGDESEFDARPGVYGAFPTFSMDNRTSYRPTNEDCLMRLVVSPHFCSACAEGLWLALLARVDLFDAPLAVSCPAPGDVAVRAPLVRVPGRAYDVRWALDGAPLPGLPGRRTARVPRGTRGVLRVDVALELPEVRRDPAGLARAWRAVVLDGTECGGAGEA